MKNAITTFALAGVFFLGGCSDEPVTAVVEQPPEQQQRSRMHDPVYLAKLKDLEKEQEERMHACAVAHDALAKAKDDRAGEDVIAKLEAAVEKAEKDFETYNEKARKTVRDRIWSDLDAKAKAKAEAENK